MNGESVRASFRVSVPPKSGSSGHAKNPTHAITSNNYFDGILRLFRVFEKDEDGSERFLPILIEATITRAEGPVKVYFQVNNKKELFKRHKSLQTKSFFLELKEVD